MHVCGGACCTHIAWGLTSPLTNDDFNRMRIALLHPLVSFFVEDGIWHLHVRTTCQHLRKQDRGCDIYSRRPRVCADYVAGECEWPDGLPWELTIRTDEQLQDYLHKRWNRVHEIEPIDALAVAAVVTWPVDEPIDPVTVDEVRWALLHREISFCVDRDGDWFMLIAAPFLDGDPTKAISPMVRKTWRAWLNTEDDLAAWLAANNKQLVGLAYDGPRPE
ncbi:MAG: YkgJ family cysteine cluster protein [Planctomycetota bacterium]